MADDSNNENALPPKLNLRKQVNTPVGPKPLVPPTTQGAAKAEAPVAPAPLATPAAPVPPVAASAADTPTQGNTMRMKLPAIPEQKAPVAEDASQASPTEKPLDANEESANTSAPRPLIRPTMVPKTIKLKKPIPLGIKRDTPDPAAPVGSKRATSKISLPASPEAQQDAAANKPTPIQIPSSSPSTETAETEPKDVPVAAAPPPPPKPAPDPKRQTSRISLESAFGSEGESGPKTIKLKRPTSNTVKVQGMTSPGAGDAKSKTANVDLTQNSESQEDDTPDTQKKTIKVKRPASRPALRTSSSKKMSVSAGQTSSGGSSSPMFTAPSKAAAPVDGAHWFFIVTGCAATIITGVLIYVQCAQALGPNYSLTELSYGAPNAELSWPGRLSR